MFPYLDLPGFSRRVTAITEEDVERIEETYPGWVQQDINSWSSRINAQLRKRLGSARMGEGSALPLGQLPPALIPQGTAPPPLTLSGRPVLGSLMILVAITTGGALGAAILKWSPDNGVTWVTGVTSAASVVLTGTGLTLGMATATYATDNAYSAATPVPETVLQWLTILVSWDCYNKRGRNPQDPLIVDLKEDRVRVLAEVAQAANSQDGLFDLPVSEDLDSAIKTGGPLFYSESSPFVSADRQEREGRIEDDHGFGTIGGSHGTR